MESLAPVDAFSTMVYGFRCCPIIVARGLTPRNGGGLGLARGFGGGGHAKAAGFRYEGTLAQLQEDLYRAVAVAFAAPKAMKAM